MHILATLLGLLIVIGIVALVYGSAKLIQVIAGKLRPDKPMDLEEAFTILLQASAFIVVLGLICWSIGATILGIG
jgi:hypothetical protein